MTKTLTLIILTILVHLAIAQDKLERPDLDVVEAIWTTEIENYLPKKPLEKSARANESLILWVKLYGRSSALNFIKTSHDLPVQIKLFKNSVLGLTPERVYNLESNMFLSEEDVKQQKEDKELNVEEVRLKEKEIASKGFFEFYVWVRLSPERLRGANRISGSIVFKDNSRLKCLNDDCEFSIYIR